MSRPQKAFQLLFSSFWNVVPTTYGSSGHPVGGWDHLEQKQSLLSYVPYIRVLNLECALESSRGFIKTDCWNPLLVFDSVFLGWCLRMFTSDDFPGDANGAGPVTTLWKSLPQINHLHVGPEVFLVMWLTPGKSSRRSTRLTHLLLGYRVVWYTARKNCDTKFFWHFVWLAPHLLLVL